MLYHFYQLSDYTSYFSNERTRIKTLLLLAILWCYPVLRTLSQCSDLICLSEVHRNTCAEIVSNGIVGRNLATKKVLAQAPPYTMPLYTSSAPVFFRTSERQIGLILTITRIPEVSKPIRWTVSTYKSMIRNIARGEATQCWPQNIHLWLVGQCCSPNIHLWLAMI